MALYLHDGRRCSLCERGFTSDDLIVGMPGRREYCFIQDDRVPEVEVCICGQCAVFSMEH